MKVNADAGRREGKSRLQSEMANRYPYDERAEKGRD
jgi:hypothetical protein